MFGFYKREIKWFLSFKDGYMENEYQIEREKFQRWNFFIFGFYLTLIIFILWGSKLGAPQAYTKTGIIINILRVILMIILFLLIIRFPRWVEEILIGHITFTLVTFVENNHDNFPILDVSDIFTYGLLFQTFNLFLILIRVRWNRLLVLLFLYNL